VKSEYNSGEIILKEDGIEDIKTKLQFELREYNRLFLRKYERKNLPLKQVTKVWNYI
jgi:hypothetical protein